MTPVSPARLEISWGGRTGWQPLKTLPDYATLPYFMYVGRFDDKPGGDLLRLDPTRFGKLFDRAVGDFVRHSIYAY